MDLSGWRETGTLTIDGVEHHVYREGRMSGDFVLERDGTVIVRAVKPSTFSSTLTVRYEGREYTLRKKSAWRRKFVVLAPLGEAGSAARTRSRIARACRDDDAKSARRSADRLASDAARVHHLADGHHVEARRRRRGCLTRRHSNTKAS
jgi:hypothetical protein